jgi:hypothetical protein
MHKSNVQEGEMKSLLQLFEMSKFKEITKKGKTLKLAETQ